MSLTKAEIKLAALQLDPLEREELAEELLLSVSDADRDAIDAAWLEEIKRRDGSVPPGGARHVDDVIARLKGSVRP